MCTVAWISFILLSIGIFIQLVYYLFFVRRILAHKDTLPVQKPSQEVSVVICAKNEADNLKVYLPKILSQRYPDFEVLVVDDHSDDATGDVLQDLRQRYDRLSIISPDQVDRKYPGKRNALLAGIKNARYELILVTDADCYPQSEEWISRMVAPLKDGVDLVLGYSPYETRPGFLNKLIRYETLNTALLYCGFSLNGFPFMGIGRNLAYRKNLFVKDSGFGADIPLSGDDDLFVNRHASGKNTKIVLDPAAWIWSQPKETARTWMHQKWRHAQAGWHYRFVHKLMLGLVQSAQAFAPLLLIACIGADPGIGAMALGLFLFRLLAWWLLFLPISNRFGVGDLKHMIPLLDVSVSSFLLILTGSLTVRPRTWK